jgi:hypothetical protein
MEIIDCENLAKLNAQYKTEIHYPVPPIRQKAIEGIIEKTVMAPVADEIYKYYPEFTNFLFSFGRGNTTGNRNS